MILTSSSLCTPTANSFHRVARRKRRSFVVAVLFLVAVGIRVLPGLTAYNSTTVSPRSLMTPIGRHTLPAKRIYRHAAPIERKRSKLPLAPTQFATR